MQLLQAELLSIFLESFLFGILVLLFGTLVTVLVRRGKDGQGQQRALLPVATILLCVGTSHIALSLTQLFQGFVFSPDPVVYFENAADPLFVAKSVLYCIQTLIGDGVLIWRCYMTFGKRWSVIVFPGLALLVNAVAGALVCNQFSRSAENSTVFKTATHFITTFFSLTVCINVFCTAAIVWRICRSGRFTGGAPNLMPVVTAFVESGTLYSCGVLGLLIAYLKRSNGQYAANDAITPLAGITYLLIALQIHFRLDPTRVLGLNGSRRRSRPALHMPGAVRSDTLVPMRPFTVHVSRETEVVFPSSGDGKEMLTRYAEGSA